MKRRRLKVAIIAPPWLALPVKGYGGIELVLESLIPALTDIDAEVVVFGNTERTLPGIETRGIYDRDMYPDIYRPMNESVPLASAHVLYALNEIAAAGDFDVIHDHLEYIGPQVLSVASRDRHVPPVIHTLHGPPFEPRKSRQDAPDTTPYWEQLARDMGRMYIVGISDALMVSAPPALRPRILKTVHNAIDVRRFPFQPDKKDYFFTLARFNTDKGHDIAARVCAKKGYRLRMAGTVAGIETNQKLLAELANPLSPYRSTNEFRYYSDQILPYVLEYPNVTYSGNVSGRDKMQFISEGRALLFPIRWEEPFGMAVIEALACGTPVVAMSRGAMPEIIIHGVNGFLADSEEEFAGYLERVGEIDPAACRKSVEDRFTAGEMARKYMERYYEAIERSR